MAQSAASVADKKEGVIYCLLRTRPSRGHRGTTVVEFSVWLNALKVILSRSLLKQVIIYNVHARRLLDAQVYVLFSTRRISVCDFV